MCFESKNPFRNFRLWEPSQAILQAHCVIDVILLREVGALAHDLPNRIIDVHHGLHVSQPKARSGCQQETKRGTGFRLFQKDYQKTAAACFVITSSLHSAGCQHCPRPTANGENERAGRWTGFDKSIRKRL
jgi:3'-phosphoadenosine 5'-phosphosulfate sulfotransferase (PAPS reductase)/FAD synthetase